ncbi:MAG: ABC transporter substrate-binding protein [Methanosarcinaceae archaeon]
MILNKTGLLIGASLLAVLLALPAAASDYTLEVFGNANEDDTINMQDVTYTELIILEYRDETELSDAKYDGKINMQDVTQIELVILGKEKELTLIDQADRIVTVRRPIERIVSPSLDGVRTVVQLGAADKIVGVSDRLVCENVRLPEVVHPELAELSPVGHQVINAELIVSLKPDVIFGSSTYADSLQETTGIPVVCLWAQGNLDFGIYRLVGTVIGTEERAEELISYANDELDKVIEITSQIPEDEKPQVYMELYRNFITPIQYDPMEIAGGINVAKDCTGVYSVQISEEQFIAWNPGIIMLQRMWNKDPDAPYSKVQAEDILSNPDYQTINAVKDRRVYHTIGHSAGWDPATGVVETLYMAKIFHPDEFEDLDMEEEGNAILERFYGVDGLYTDMAEGRRLHGWE